MVEIVLSAIVLTLLKKRNMPWFKLPEPEAEIVLLVMVLKLEVVKDMIP